MVLPFCPRLSFALPALGLLAALAMAGEATAGAPPKQPTAEQPRMPSPPLPAKSAPDATPTPTPKIVDQAPGVFDTVFVVDEGPHRVLRFGAVDADDQTMIVRGKPSETPVEYVHTAGAVLGFSKAPARRPRKALIIGLGGGAFAHQLARLDPGIEIDAVEIDPVVVRFARRYFGLEDVPHLTVSVQDGAAFVKEQREKWDVIFLDAYGSDDMAPALVSSSFFLGVRQRVAREGAVVLNLAVSEANEQKILRRFIPLFSRCVAVRTPEDRNLVVIGTDRGIDLRHARASDVARRQRAKLPLLPLPFRPCSDPEPE